MASKDSPLGYLVIAMTIVTLARYQLLSSYHYVNSLGYNVCYADTDSLMVESWPSDDCNVINEYLNLPYVDLKFEQRMKCLLVLSKKRYIYKTMKDQIQSKGFQKRVNDLTKFMSNKIINRVIDLGGKQGYPSDGWVLWVETLVETYLKCRDAKKYSITRKTKKLEDYKSTSCAAVKILQRYPEKSGEYVEFTFSRADVASSACSSWIMDVKDCQYVNFEQLFISQKKIFCTLLNIGFWRCDKAHQMADMVLNTMHWKHFLHAELLTFMKSGEKLKLLVERGVKYTFKINNHNTRIRRRMKLIRNID